MSIVIITLLFLFHPSNTSAFLMSSQSETTTVSAIVPGSDPEPVPESASPGGGFYFFYQPVPSIPANTLPQTIDEIYVPRPTSLLSPWKRYTPTIDSVYGQIRQAPLSGVGVMPPVPISVGDRWVFASILFLVLSVLVSVFRWLAHLFSTF